jgi:membrane-associated phospholipid phosphatase
MEQTRYEISARRTHRAGGRPGRRHGIGLVVTRRRITRGISRPVFLASVFAVAAIAIYAAMWVGYRQQWSWLHDFDWTLLNLGHDTGIKHPGAVQFWNGVSAVLGPVPLRWIDVVAMVVALVQRNVRAALVLFACAPLSGLVTTGAKDLANRPRPSTMLAPVPSSSFPSGHALETTVMFLALLSFVLPMLSPKMRCVAIAVSALSVLSVGIARVGLNVHYPSDVLAGWSLGYLYFLLCLLVFRPPQVFAGNGAVT